MRVVRRKRLERVHSAKPRSKTRTTEAVLVEPGSPAMPDSISRFGYSTLDGIAVRQDRWPGCIGNQVYDLASLLAAEGFRSE